jgi:hypothetical protein
MNRKKQKKKKYKNQDNKIYSMTFCNPMIIVLISFKSVKIGIHSQASPLKLVNAEKIYDDNRAFFAFVIYRVDQK